MSKTLIKPVEFSDSVTPFSAPRAPRPGLMKPSSNLMKPSSMKPSSMKPSSMKPSSMKVSSSLMKPSLMKVTSWNLHQAYAGCTESCACQIGEMTVQRKHEKSLGKQAFRVRGWTGSGGCSTRFYDEPETFISLMKPSLMKPSLMKPSLMKVSSDLMKPSLMKPSLMKPSSMKPSSWRFPKGATSFSWYAKNIKKALAK